MNRDLSKTPSFAQFLCQAQILILEILNVFLWLKFSPSLNLNKIEHFSKVPKLVLLCASPLKTPDLKTEKTSIPYTYSI